MKYLVLFGFVFLLSACNLFPSKEIQTQELVSKELRTIDFNEVDSYPLFATCDESSAKAEQRQCFERVILNHFSAKFEEHQLQLTTETNLYIDFLISHDGQISILTISKNEAIEKQIPQFNVFVQEIIDALPAVSPALKRGIPVKTKFRIPIVLNTL